MFRRIVEFRWTSAPKAGIMPTGRNFSGRAPGVSLVNKNNAATIFSAVLLLSLTAINPAAALSITDFNSWTQVQDPADPGMTGSLAAGSPSTQATLTATGSVPASTDIGYQSVSGNTVAGSLSGNYFSVAQDFHIAIDFDVSASASVGLAGIGFGIGEDGAGANSAGAGLAINNGSPAAFAGSARINDVTQTPALLALLPSNVGRFFIRYVSSTGDIIFGVSATPGSAAPTATGTFAGLQNSWNDNGLLVSFFLRSDSPALASGSVQAVFSNFEILAGTPVPIAVVPLPATLWLLLSGLAPLWLRWRRRA
jgi:hypothetical protein